LKIPQEKRRGFSICLNTQVWIPFLPFVVYGSPEEGQTFSTIWIPNSCREKDRHVRIQKGGALVFFLLCERGGGNLKRLMGVEDVLKP